MIVPILGAGSHAQDVAAIVRSTGHEVAFYDDALEAYPDCSDVEGGALVGVYDPVVRASLDPRFLVGAVDSFITVSPDANVDATAWVGHGGVVGPGATLGNGVELGAHVHVGQNASLVRVEVGDYSSISPGAIICGDVHIGQLVTIGAGAVVSNLCTIGDGAIIGAGAVIPPRTKVPSWEVWAGVPARRIA